MLGKNCSDKLFPYTKLYRQGVLLPLTLRDCIFYSDDETTLFLEHCLNITDNELNEIIGQYEYKTSSYRYPLSVTIFEYWKALCTAERVRNETRKIIRERNKKWHLI